MPGLRLAHDLAEFNTAHHVLTLGEIFLRQLRVMFTPQVKLQAIVTSGLFEATVECGPVLQAFLLTAHLHIEALPFDKQRHGAVLMGDHLLAQGVGPGVEALVFFKRAFHSRLPVSAVTHPSSRQAHHRMRRNTSSSPRIRKKSAAMRQTRPKSPNTILRPVTGTRSARVTSGSIRVALAMAYNGRP